MSDLSNTTRNDSGSAKRLNPWLLLGFAAIFANFYWFTRHVFYARFAADEMMNMGWAWRDGLSKLLSGLFGFWVSVYRPTGGLYYWLLHHYFGLNPLPYRIVDFGIVSINLVIAYILMRRLTGSVYVAWLGTFIFSYHTAIDMWAIFVGSFVYDRLCFTFYLLAFLAYIAWRENTGLRRALTFAAFVASYLLALGAKEMAVTLPVMLVLYEVVYHPEILKFRRRESLGVVAAIGLLGLITLGFIYFRVFAKDSVIASGAYATTDLSLSHFFHSQADYLNELRFRSQDYVPRPNAVFVFLSMLGISALFRSRHAFFATLWALLTPLPIVFIQRGGGCLYIVYFGWALFVAILSQQLAVTFARWLPNQPVFRIAALALCASPVWFLFQKNQEYQGYWEQPFLATGDKTWSVISQLTKLNPSVRDGDTIAYLRTPFEGWDVLFITQLWCRNPKVNIYLNQESHLSEEQLRGSTIVLDFDESGVLHQIRPDKSI